MSSPIERHRSAAPGGVPGGRARRPRLRLVRALGIVLAIVALLSGITWIWILPWMLQQRGRGMLVDLGFRDVTIGGARLSLRSLDLTDMTVGAGAPLRAERAHVTFDPRDAVRGRVQELVMDGAIWDLTRVRDRWFAPFDELRPREPSGAVPSATLAAATRALPVLPLDRIELRRCRIVVPSGRATETLIGDVEVRRVVDTWHIDVSLRSADQTFDANAELREDQGRAAGAIRLRFGDVQAPLTLTGTAAVAASAAGRSWMLDLEADPAPFRVRWAGRGVAASARLGLSLRATPSDAGTSVRWSTRLVAPATAACSLPGSGWGALEGTQLTGSVRAAGTLVTGRPADARGELQIAELTLRGVADAWHIDGVDTTLAWTGLGLDTIASIGRQELRWRAAAFGELGAGAGSVAFEVRPGPVLDVETVQWSVDEAGSMSTGAFQVDPAAVQIATKLSVRDVPLAAWLGIVSQGRVAGSGRLMGWLDLRVRTSPRFDVELAGGQLRASGGGIVRFMDDPATQQLVAEQVARIAADSSRYQGAVQQRIVEALKDFAFEQLSFDLVPSGAGLDLRTHLAGRGRKVPQELDLDLNLNGFDALVDLALDVKLGLARAKDRTQRVLESRSSKDLTGR